MPAQFHDEDGLITPPRLRDRRRLSAALDDVVHQYCTGVRRIRLRYIFTTDERLADMNRQYLQHDTYTDILTFDLSGGPAEVVGEIYISTDRVAENAATHGTAYTEELHRVIFHGALHLCDLPDKTEAEATAMRAAEDRCLDAYLRGPRA